jgi:hypothetical protein
MPGSRKRQRRATGNEDINQLCWDWFQEATQFHPYYKYLLDDNPLSDLVILISTQIQL